MARTLAWRAPRRGWGPSRPRRGAGAAPFPPRSPCPAPLAPDAESGPAPGTLIWGNGRDLGSLGFLQAVVTVAQGRCPAACCALGMCRACTDRSTGPASGGTRTVCALSWKAGQRPTEFSTVVPVARACAKLADHTASSGAQTGVSSCHPRSPSLGVLRDAPWHAGSRERSGQPSSSSITPAASETQAQATFRAVRHSSVKRGFARSFRVGNGFQPPCGRRACHGFGRLVDFFLSLSAR